MSRFIVRVQSASGRAETVHVWQSTETRACRIACQVAAELYGGADWRPISALRD